MFYSPYSVYPQSAYSYNRAPTRAYAPAAYPYAYARALAEERAARERDAAARRAAAEQEARARLARYAYGQDDDDEEEGVEYGYPYGYSPRERAYLEAKRKQEALQKERERLIAEERSRREAESLRTRRERDIRAALEPFYRNLGREVPDSAKNAEKAKYAAVEPTSRTPSPKQSAPSRTASPSQPAATACATEIHRATPTQDETEAAATTIQSFYRSRKALSAISQLETSFENLKRAFVLPPAIDFLSADGSIISIKSSGTTTGGSSPPPSDITTAVSSTPKLAFTSTNVPIRAYDEDLNRVLAKLDAVESWGKKEVRERRRDVVRRVEREAGRVESAWSDVWRRFVERKEESEVDEALDEEEQLADIAVGNASVEDRTEEAASSALPSEDLQPTEIPMAVDADVEVNAVLDASDNLTSPTPSEEVPQSVGMTVDDAAADHRTEEEVNAALEENVLTRAEEVPETTSDESSAERHPEAGVYVKTPLEEESTLIPPPGDVQESTEMTLDEPSLQLQSSDREIPEISDAFTPTPSELIIAPADHVSPRAESGEIAPNSADSPARSSILSPRITPDATETETEDANINEPTSPNSESESDDEMESQDSDYESVGSFFSGEQGDSFGSDEGEDEVDFVML